MKRRKPNKVLNYMTDKMRDKARELIGNQLYETMFAGDDGYQIYMCAQKHGWVCFEDKNLVIPEWSYCKPETGNNVKKLNATSANLKEFWVYYLAHELAHAVSGDGTHGPQFMYRFKIICPIELQFFELGYKPRNAKAAGITRS